MKIELFDPKNMYWSEERKVWSIEIPLVDGRYISIIAGENQRSKPSKILRDPQGYEWFEVAILRDLETGEKVTQQYDLNHEFGILCYQSVSEINEIINRIHSGELTPSVGRGFELHWPHRQIRGLVLLL